MSWEQIEERLAMPFSAKIDLSCGTIWLPADDITIEQWLISSAQSDEELREIEIPAINFLQNRWRMETLVEFRWSKSFDRRNILAMYTKERAYILFGDKFEYHVIAALAPKDQPDLYQAVLDGLMENPHFIPQRPVIANIRRPDLISIPDAWTSGDDRLHHVFGGENFSGIGGPVDWMHPGHQTRRAG